MKQADPQKRILPKQTDFDLLCRMLQETLGDPDKLHRASPICYCQSALEVLIATILTQATTDRNALAAWENLRSHYPDFAAILEVNPGELEQVIRSAGLAAAKSRTIQGVLREVRRRFGEDPPLSAALDTLKNDPAQAGDFLKNLAGVGPKTVACTLLFGLGLAAFPVDTHIHRIAIRLGWVPPGTSPASAQELLTLWVPQKYQARLHILLLNLGRVYCRPQGPRCGDCPLAGECPSATTPQ